MKLPDKVYLHPDSALDIYSTKDGEGRVAYYRQDLVDKYDESVELLRRWMGAHHQQNLPPASETVALLSRIDGGQR